MPSLGFMRLFPPGTEKIQNHPPIKISEFLLADVLVEAQSPFKSIKSLIFQIFVLADFLFLVVYYRLCKTLFGGTHHQSVSQSHISGIC